MTGEDWRVEVELDDEQHGYSLRERLRSLDLDEQARKRLGPRVIVSRDGSRLFLYAATAEQSREAERVIRELVAAENLTAEISTTRWHPVEQAWKDPAAPLPATSEEIAAEQSRLEEAERQEAEHERAWDWHVRIELPNRDVAVALAEELNAQGRPVHRRWRYVTVDEATEEAATELAERVRDKLPADSKVSVEVRADVPDPVFVLLGSRF